MSAPDNLAEQLFPIGFELTGTLLAVLRSRNPAVQASLASLLDLLPALAGGPLDSFAAWEAFVAACCEQPEALAQVRFLAMLADAQAVAAELRRMARVLDLVRTMLETRGFSKSRIESLRYASYMLLRRPGAFQSV